MNQFKGTPGEWIASESDTYAGAVDVDSYDAAWCVCTCWGDGSDEGKKQAEIHARAIAAVPKMIAALIEAEKRILSDSIKIDGEWGDPRNPSAMPVELDMVRCAIAAALGE